jgi:Ydr279p protein family (RNase H2 complex component) wHTH domain/Ydr279p protein triple barrel domain
LLSANVFFVHATDHLISKLSKAFYYIALRRRISLDKSKMGAQTRSSSTSNSPVKSSTQSSGAHEQGQPLKLFILPKNAPSAARFLFLKHPHDGIRRRFYFCPINGLYEFKKVNATPTDPRSILFGYPIGNPPTNTAEAQEPADMSKEEEADCRPQHNAGTVDVASGYVNQAAEVFVATPVDMVFILIPLLSTEGLSTKSNTGKALFQPLDDLLDKFLEEDQHLRYILERGRHMLESAVAKLCDIVEAGDEKMFRLNNDKLFKTILEKAQTAAQRGLPSSLKEKFVKRTLEKPVLSVKREESSLSVMTESNVDSLGGSFGTGDSQCSTATSFASTVASEASLTTTAAGKEGEAIPDDITNLQRLRTTWSFIASSYLPDQLADKLTGLLSSKVCPVDFVPLEAYLSNLETLRAEVLASRSLSSFGVKRGLDGDTASETRAEKKRKQEEDEKRKKAGESRGVRDLKKVDVSGMKKMSAFFRKTSTAKVNS